MVCNHVPMQYPALGEDCIAGSSKLLPLDEVSQDGAIPRNRLFTERSQRLTESISTQSLRACTV